MQYYKDSFGKNEKKSGCGWALQVDGESFDE